MDRSNWAALCAYTSSVWGRPMSEGQKAAGWKLLAGFPNEAVEGAITVIAESGREQMPPWSMVYKAAESLAHAMRDLQPQLPAGDSLSDAEHEAAMIRLRAKQPPEQRRRASHVTRETKGLSMQARLRVAQELLTGANGRLQPLLWDRLAEEVLAREFQLVQPLLSQGRSIHE